MGGGLKISKGLIFAERRSGFGRRYIPDEACFPRVFEVAYLAADSDRIPKRLLKKRVCARLPALGKQTRATLCDRRCAKESEARAQGCCDSRGESRCPGDSNPSHFED